MMRSIYIHLPFCAQKCRYCDFLSAPASSRVQARYVEALLLEMAARVDARWRAPETIFIGGGTPSFLEAALWERLLEGIATYIAPTAETEWTVEANPASGHYAWFRRLRDGGVNRLSMGVQSFDDRELRLLGRAHTAAEAREAYEDARRAGFQNINLDLIYALPGQSLAAWQRNVEAALAMAPEHLSLYGLILEEGTPLTAAVDAGRLPEPSDAMAAEAMGWQTERLARAGYEVYEISNYARPGYACRHNRAYWALTPWLGLGLGATGREGLVVSVAETDLEGYCTVLEGGRLPIETTVLCPEEAMSDAMMMGLRERAGVDRQTLRARWGFDFCALWPRAIEEEEAAGRLAFDGERLRLTASGRLHGNDVFMRFLTPERP